VTAAPHRRLMPTVISRKSGAEVATAEDANLRRQVLTEVKNLNRKRQTPRQAERHGWLHITGKRRCAAVILVL